MIRHPHSRHADEIRSRGTSHTLDFISTIDASMDGGQGLSPGRGYFALRTDPVITVRVRPPTKRGR